MLTNYFYNSIWACELNYLRVMEKVVLEHRKLSAIEIVALEAELGKRLDNSQNQLYTRNEGKTAVIPIKGSIVRYGDMLTDISGATSVSALSLKLNEALNNPAIEDIVFTIDSPGGEAKGISEFADMIYNARGTKPIKAYVTNAQSAAYWIASACDEIVCDDTAGLGSIGVALFLDDDTQAQEEAGVKEIIVRNSLSPNKIPDFKTEEGMKQITERLDKMADVFFSKVALYRSKEGKQLTAKDVVSEFKQGGTATGQEAVDLGMADRIGSLEGLLKELKERNMADNKNSEVSKENASANLKPEVTAEQFSELETKFQQLMEASEKASKSSKEAIEAAESKVKAAEEQAKLLAEEIKRVGNEKAEAEKKAAEIALGAQAEKAYTDLKDKLVPAQKESFIELYKFISTADGDVEKFVSFVGASTAIETLKEEQLADGDLIVLEQTKESKDQWAEIDAQVAKYAAELNKRQAKSAK